MCSARTRWEQTDAGIRWDFSGGECLPHEDHLEMSGKYVSQYVTYRVTEKKEVETSQILVWPWLRLFPNDTHASMKTSQEGQKLNPVWLVNGEERRVTGREILFDGCLKIRESDGTLLDTERSFFPSMEGKGAVVRFCVRNRGESRIAVKPVLSMEKGTQRGAKGIYLYESQLEPEGARELNPGESACWYLIFTAHPMMEAVPMVKGEDAFEERQHFLETVKRSMALTTPDPVLNQLFYFAKIRSMESIFWTRAGLLHSPGGLHYYAAVWTNDQVEYANPFFIHSGLADPEASVWNCLRLYQKFMGPGYEAIPSSIIAEGEGIWEGKKDRGDAAMFAYGTSRTVLLSGSREKAEEFFPSIRWCLYYCRKRLLPEGVIASDSDELEGRFPHGKANLATSCLVYEALRTSAILAEELGEKELAEEYRDWREELGRAIDTYFGCQIHGFDTYRYCEANEALRSWICIPLTMGIQKRRKATLEALFSDWLWTENGLLTMEGDKVFWDRSTLYGLRGAFMAGEPEKGLYYLRKYSEQRLLGEHVPYPVEAWPEGDQRHLSAESALYCRIYLEGLLGIAPEGLESFSMKPSLPAGWEEVVLDQVQAAGKKLCIRIRKKKENYDLELTADGGCTHRYFSVKAGEAIKIRM